MPYLLLTNRRGLLRRLPEWFPDSKDELLVVAGLSSLTGDPDPSQLPGIFRHFTVAENDGGPEHDAELIRLCRQHRVERILSTGEHDIVRAARLRAALGLAGQQLPSATAYRDKFVMKTLTAAGGVTVTPMRMITDGDGLRDFVHEVGIPVVVKPVDGGGGVGVRSLRDVRAVDRYVARWSGGAASGPRLAEAWVEGDFYQVNGLMAHGEVLWSWPSRNLHPDLGTLTHGLPGISGMLPPGHPLFQPLLRATAATVAALPPAPEVRPLHAEFFRTARGELVLCEIACRAGGAAIVETHERAFGVNLHAAGLLGQADRPVLVPVDPPDQRLGFAWFPPQNGVLTRLPAHCDLPSVVRYSISGVPGSRYELPRGLGPSIAQLVFGLTDSDVAVELGRVADWWNAGAHWQLVGPEQVGAGRHTVPARLADQAGGSRG